MYSLSILPFRNDNITQVNFSGKNNPLKSANKYLTSEQLNKIPKDLGLHPEVFFSMKNEKTETIPLFVDKRTAKKAIAEAIRLKLTMSQLLERFLPEVKIKNQGVKPQKPVSGVIGDCEATIFTDGEQIFKMMKKELQKSKKYILHSGFQMQNLKIDGYRNPVRGADAVKGFKEQQEISGIFVQKAQKDKLPVLTILDVHKWRENGYGQKDVHHNNVDMIRHLKKGGVDVLPAPLPVQGGGLINHTKVYVIDGDTAIVTGMNAGSHSPANHDFAILLKKLPDKTNSEIDNVIEYFYENYEYALKKLGTPIADGPLNKDEQQYYTGLKKKIKPEFVEFQAFINEQFKSDIGRKEFFKPKYDSVENPKIKLLKTSTREIAGHEKGETIKKEFFHHLKKADYFRAWNFVFTEKESAEVIIKRHKEGNLDAMLIIGEDILNKFPYCRKVYYDLQENGVPVQIYDHNTRTNQRMHAKMNLFGYKKTKNISAKNDLNLHREKNIQWRILTGSFNNSEVGLSNNPGQGFRDDSPLFSEKILAEIKEYAETVKIKEQQLGLPPILDEIKELGINDKKKIKKIMQIRKEQIKKATKQVTKNNSATVTIDETVHYFDRKRKDDSNLSTVLGYYVIMLERINYMPKYKRGNSELGISFELTDDMSKSLLKQFENDYKHSILDVDDKYQYEPPKHTKKVKK